MLTTMGRVVGIDYGSERIGVALSDPEARFAFPHTIVRNGPGALDDLAAIVREADADTVVLGLSVNYRGKENPLMDRVRALAEELEKRTGARIAYEDETLTSQQARRAYEQKEKTRKPDKHEALDASAAALILQQYLDMRAV